MLMSKSGFTQIVGLTAETKKGGTQGEKFSPIIIIKRIEDISSIRFLCKTKRTARMIHAVRFIMRLVLAYLYQEFETEYKRVYREHHDPRAERLRKAESLDQREDATDADGKPRKAVLISDETPEDEYIAKEHFIIHTSSFTALSDSDRDILTGFINAGYNARELARRLGKDPSGVLKLVKRAAARLEKKIAENS